MRRRAEIVEAVAEVGGHPVFSTPKSHQVRSVPIPRFLVDELARHVAAREPDEFVFTSPRGSLLRLQNFRHTVVNRATRNAGLHGLTPHSLRHAAAWLAITSGADVKVVQQIPAYQTRERDDDSRPLRPPLRRPAGRSGRPSGPTADRARTFCGPNRS